VVVVGIARPRTRQRCPVCCDAQSAVAVQGTAIAQPPAVGWDRGADRASNDAEVSSIPPIIRRVDEDVAVLIPPAEGGAVGA
jgi:hypothetical protein